MNQCFNVSHWDIDDYRWYWWIIFKKKKVLVEIDYWRYWWGKIEGKITRIISGECFWLGPVFSVTQRHKRSDHRSQGFHRSWGYFMGIIAITMREYEEYMLKYGSESLSPTLRNHGFVGDETTYLERVKGCFILRGWQYMLNNTWFNMV